jgi:hypothetical protein
MSRVTLQEALSFPMHCDTGEEDLHDARGIPSRKYCEMVRFWSAELADICRSPLGQCERAYTCRSYSSYLCIYIQGKTRWIAGTKRRL